MSSLKPCLLGFFYGLRDSILGIGVIAHIDDESKCTNNRPLSRRSARPDKKKGSQVLPMLAQCCFLNGGVLLFSVMLFECAVIPAVKYLMDFVAVFMTSNRQGQSAIWTWLEPIMNYTFKYLWVVPLFWLCKILNCFWFVEIADVAYRKKMGRPVSTLLTSKDSIFKALSKIMADFLFSIQVEVLFLVQAQLVGLIPIVGPLISFLHMCLLYSLYAFEYTWSNSGWTVVKRLSYIENNWSYFVGFGVLLSAMTSFAASTVISACIFGISFPVFILSGLESQPTHDGEYPLRLFSLVIWITNKMFLLRSTRSKVNLAAKEK